MPKHAISALFLLLASSALGAGCQLFTASETVTEPDITRARASRTAMERADGSGSAADARAAQAKQAAAPHAVEEQQPVESATASHILIRYAGTRNAGPDVKRSKEQAKKLADQIAAKAAGGADFAALAEKYTEDPSGKGRGGRLGTFGRGRMVPEFDQATFALTPGKTSGVIETDFGYHIIYREK